MVELELKWLKLVQDDLKWQTIHLVSYLYLDLKSQKSLTLTLSQTKGYDIGPYKHVPKEIYDNLKAWKAKQLGIPPKDIPNLGEPEAHQSISKRTPQAKRTNI